MAAKSKIEEAVEWYKANFIVYERLTNHVEAILKDILKKEKINFHTVTSRPKSIDKYIEKASKEKYKDPKSEIMDMAGIRVITYLDTDAKKVEEIVKRTFQYIPEHNGDKTKELGENKVGYRSIHCICTLGEERLKLPENSDFKNCLFEIQIRTILQHAWAEFEHDRNYKFKGVLPPVLKRRLAIVSANLELMDWTFESIATSVLEYSKGLHEKTSKGDLTPQITSASLNIYLGKKLEELVKAGLRPILFFDSRIIDELAAMDIKNLEQLDRAIPKDFVKINFELHSYYNYTGALIDIMIINDATKYFEKAWKQSWGTLDIKSIDLYKHYGVPIEQLMKKYDIEAYSEEYEPPEYEEDFEPPEYEPDYEPPEEEPPDFEADYEPPDEEPPEEEPPDFEADYEPPDEEPPEEEPPDDEHTDDEES